ncbi:hypothetical protein H9P43_001797 [Blastocladiella emersonii ATCC 22665]|nr:hypothetical protein H9P43_001797 [Blastocladiella emersonii ATCC 22665]
MAEAVKVVLRCRPFSEKEKAAGHANIVKIDETDARVCITDPNAGTGDAPKCFTFDSAFDWNCKQLDVYNKTALPIVESVLNGYNGTIFAYGQTGTGKSFSMEGVRDVPELRGIIPNSFEHIFSHIRSAGGGVKFLVRASYLEIYNEEIRDLLASGATRLELKEHPDTGVYVKDLSSFVVKDVTEMDKLMNQGNKNRSVGFTEMNARSSRSHSIFTITIEMSEERDGKECIRMGKLHLVDLAGSERQSKTGATGDRLKEATKINLSLSCLGNVIKALVDGKSSHVPYRDSKLTRLLQDSLGGNARTMMIATMSPASYNYDETISTLRYAARAKSIKNKPKINEDPKDAMLRMFQEEIARLRAQLEMEGGAGGEGGDVAPGTEAATGGDDAGAVDSGTEEPDPDEGADSGGGGAPPTAGDAGPASPTTTTTTGGAPPGRKNAGLTLEEMRLMEQRIEEEKRSILESKDMIESEKQALLGELAARQAEIDGERKQREELLAKLEQMESKLLVGGVNLLDKEVQQREELARQAAELEARKQQQLLIQHQMQQEEEAALQMEEEYNSLQDEAAAKTQKIKKLWSLLMNHKAELKDLTEEYQREREDLLDTIRDLSRELKFKMKLVERFIPDRELHWIESNAEWDEVNEQWHVRFAAHAGNNVRGQRLPSHSHVRHQQLLHSANGGGGSGVARRTGGASVKAGTASSAMGPEPPSCWPLVYPTPEVYLSYERGGGGSAGGMVGAGGPRIAGLAHGGPSAARMRTSAAPSSGGTQARPQAARTKSGTRSSRPAGAGTAASPTPSSPPKETPVARGLVARPKHYA